MRWYAGRQLHPHSSTMTSRGETIGPYANKFVGTVAAEEIREAVFQKHARERKQKFEATGDPMWNTDTSTTPSVQPVENSRKTVTHDRVGRGHQSPLTSVHPYATDASREKVGWGAESSGGSKHKSRGTAIPVVRLGGRLSESSSLRSPAPHPST